jgi:hypothetical protein
MRNRVSNHILVSALILLLVCVPSICRSGNYEYTEDIEKRKKDELWSKYRNKIGDVYQAKAGSEFYEKSGNRYRAFIVKEDERFIVLDGCLRDGTSNRNYCYFSTSGKRPANCDTSHSTIMWEVKFDSGKIAYISYIYFKTDVIRIPGYVSRLDEEEILKILSDSKKRRQRGK